MAKFKKNKFGLKMSFTHLMWKQVKKQTIHKIKLLVFVTISYWNTFVKLSWSCSRHENTMLGHCNNICILAMNLSRWLLLIFKSMEGNRHQLLTSSEHQALLLPLIFILFSYFYSPDPETISTLGLTLILIIICLLPMSPYVTWSYLPFLNCL